MKVLPPQALAMSSVSGKRENTDGWRQLCSEVFANGRAMGMLHQPDLVLLPGRLPVVITGAFTDRLGLD